MIYWILGAFFYILGILCLFGASVVAVDVKHAVEVTLSVISFTSLVALVLIISVASTKDF